MEYFGGRTSTTIAVIGFSTYFLAITIDTVMLSGFEMIVGVMLVTLGFFQHGRNSVIGALMYIQMVTPTLTLTLMIHPIMYMGTVPM